MCLGWLFSFTIYYGVWGWGKSFKEKVCIYYGKNDHTVDVCYRKCGHPPRQGVARGNAHANNVGSDAQEVGEEMKMKVNEGSIIHQRSI